MDSTKTKEDRATEREGFYKQLITEMIAQIDSELKLEYVYHVLNSYLKVGGS